MTRTMIIVEKVKILSPILDWPNESRFPGGNIYHPSNLGSTAYRDSREKLLKQQWLRLPEL